MPLKLGPAGVPLSCKGRTIVEGMDDITTLGLDAMEIQTGTLSPAEELRPVLASRYPVLEF